MSRIFLSHSNGSNAEAVGLRDWLEREGWEDVFLDVTLTAVLREANAGSVLSTRRRSAVKRCCLSFRKRG